MFGYNIDFSSFSKKTRIVLNNTEEILYKLRLPNWCMLFWSVIFLIYFQQIKGTRHLLDKIMLLAELGQIYILY